MLSKSTPTKNRGRGRGPAGVARNGEATEAIGAVGRDTRRYPDGRGHERARQRTVRVDAFANVPLETEGSRPQTTCK